MKNQIEFLKSLRWGKPAKFQKMVTSIIEKLEKKNKKS